MKVILISAGVVSLAMALRFSVPAAVNGIPAIWSVVLSWLKPPYLYIIINGIIITIAASSRFHQSHSSEPPAARSEHLISVKSPTPSNFASLTDMNMNAIVEEPTAAEVVVSEIEDSVVELKPVMVNGSKVDNETEEEEVEEEMLVSAEAEGEAEDVFIDSTFTYNSLPQEMNSPEFQLEFLLPVREKPLATSRFAHRKPIRSNPEGKFITEKLQIYFFKICRI